MLFRLVHLGAINFTLEHMAVSLGQLGNMASRHIKAVGSKLRNTQHQTIRLPVLYNI